MYNVILMSVNSTEYKRSVDYKGRISLAKFKQYIVLQDPKRLVIAKSSVFGDKVDRYLVGCMEEDFEEYVERLYGRGIPKRKIKRLDGSNVATCSFKGTRMTIESRLLEYIGIVPHRKADVIINEESKHDIALFEIWTFEDWKTIKSQ